MNPPSPFQSPRGSGPSGLGSGDFAGEYGNDNASEYLDPRLRSAGYQHQKQHPSRSHREGQHHSRDRHSQYGRHDASHLDSDRGGGRQAQQGYRHQHYDDGIDSGGSHPAPPAPEDVLHTWQLSKTDINFVQRLSSHALALNYYGGELLKQSKQQSERIAQLAEELASAYKEIARMQKQQTPAEASQPANPRQEAERIKRIVARVRDDPELSAKVLFNRNDLYRRDPMGILKDGRADPAHPSLRDILRTEDGERTTEARFDLILTSMRGIRARLRALSFPSYVPDGEKMTFALYKHHHQALMDDMLSKEEDQILELALGAGHWKPYEILKKLLRKEGTLGQRRDGRQLDDDEDSDSDEEDEPLPIPRSSRQSTSKATAKNTGNSRQQVNEHLHKGAKAQIKEKKTSGPSTKKRSAGTQPEPEAGPSKVSFKKYSHSAAYTNVATGGDDDFADADNEDDLVTPESALFRLDSHTPAPFATHGKVPMALSSRRAVPDIKASTSRVTLSDVSSPVAANPASQPSPRRSPLAGPSRLKSPGRSQLSAEVANLSMPQPGRSQPFPWRSPLAEATNLASSAQEPRAQHQGIFPPQKIMPDPDNLLSVIRDGFLTDKALLRDMKALLQRLKNAQAGRGPTSTDVFASTATPLSDKITDKEAMIHWVEQLAATELPEKDSDEYGSSFGHRLFKRGFGIVNWEEGLSRWSVMCDVDFSLRVLYEMVRLLDIAFVMVGPGKPTLLEGTLVPKVVRAMQAAWDSGAKLQEERQSGKRKLDEAATEAADGDNSAEDKQPAAKKALTVPQLKVLWYDVLKLPRSQYRKAKDDVIERLLAAQASKAVFITQDKLETAQARKAPSAGPS
ncbi:hypothetical protein OC835_007273 [Tilletia horrida]|nr:hypothetical protein OC835_007273 [Tilletia horrida]